MWKLLRNLVIVAVLCIALLKLVLWYETQQGAARLAARLAPIAQVRYDSVASSLDGAVQFRGVTITVGKAAARDVWRAAQVDLTTPGALWLVRRMLLDDQSLPDHLGVAIKGLQAPATTWVMAEGSSPWLSPLSLVPFETLGCGVVSRFSVADYQRMGLNPGAQRQSFEYHYDSANSALTFSAQVDAPPFSSIGVRGDLQKFSPQALSGANWRQLHVGELSVAYTDLGYLAKRNRFCALQAGISPAQFVAQHVSAVGSFLAQQGIEPGTQIVSVYRALVAEGGRVSVLSLPPAGSSIGRLLAESPDSLTRQLNLTARRNDAPPVMVRLTYHSEPETASLPGTDVASTGGAESPAAPGSTPAVPAGATAAAATAKPAPAIAPGPAPVAPPPAPPAVARPAPSAPPRPTPVAAAQKVPAPAASVPEHGSKPAPAAPPRTERPSQADAAATLPSGPPPPPGSTLALVWKPTMDRLETAPPPPRDYDVIEVSALGGYVGRYVRLLTKTQKKIEGRVIGIDNISVGMRIKQASGSAELQVPRSIVVEVQVPHRQRRDDDG